MSIGLVAIGASWGGTDALATVLAGLPAAFPVPIAVVLHRHPGSPPGHLELQLGRSCALRIADVRPRNDPRPGYVYVAPPDRHLLLWEGMLCLSDEVAPHHHRPSIDLLLESAAIELGPALVGVILTGTGNDGAAGLAAVREHGGITVVQEPSTAERRDMPDAAIAATSVHRVAGLEEIPAILQAVCSPLVGARVGSPPHVHGARRGA